MPDFDLPPINAPFDTTKPGTIEAAVVDWAEYRLREGQRFVESSIGYDKIAQAQDAIFAYEKATSANYAPVRGNTQSRTEVNLVAKTAEDVTALLTDTKAFWNYGTNNARYQNQARYFNKRSESWYTKRLIDLRFADVIRFYTMAGTGYAHLYYSKRLNDMMVEAEDPRHVFPIEPISYHTIQDAQGVIIRRARTPNWVKAEYGKTVPPDIGGAGIFGWFSRIISNSVASPKRGPLSKNQQADAIPHTPTVFVNTMYLTDNSVNKTGKTLYMGEWKDEHTPLTQWSYKVEPGMPVYPFKRLIVWGGGALLYDNTSPYWHAMFPVIKLTLNPWPKAWLGKAPLWDVLPLNQSVNAALRVVDDHLSQIAQPGVKADRNVSKAELDRFNSRTPGYKIRTNQASGKGIEIINPPQLDDTPWKLIEVSLDFIQKISGTADVSQMAALNQIPSDDTIDTIMKAMTPGIRLRSRIIEGFMKEFAEMLLSCMTQFDSLSKRLAEFGPDAVMKEDFDFAKGSLIPDDIPDGDPGDIASDIDALGAGPRPVYSRAKAMLQSFTFTFKTGSLLNSAAQQERMADLLYAKMGYMSAFTLMENAGKSNFAPPDLPIPPDEIGRLQLQQQLGIGMIANSQGRKATDAAPPAMGTNAAGPTITTS